MIDVLHGLWRFEALHPEWSEEGNDGWEENVAWWALDSGAGLVLIDPLVADWGELDRLLDEHGGCTAIVRTIHWHQRSIADAAARYDAKVWAKLPPEGAPSQPYDHPVSGGEEVPGGMLAFEMERADEIALWLPVQAALVFGDAMLRAPTGELKMCPPTWEQPGGGRERLRAVLAGLTELPVEHVLVSHGPHVLGDGRSALPAALGS